MSYIYHFDHPQTTDPDVAGGKGANLARLATAGFPVPTGFTLGVEAYRAFVGDLVCEMPCDDDSDQALARYGAAIRATLCERPLPAQVERDVRAALDRFPADCAWSVRSSATCEDSAGAAFAGQHDTFLNMRGADAVLEAIRACWISLWGERALLYRRRQGFGGQDAAMAVVIQQLIPCAVAGVAFSVNPVSGRMDELVIDANLGLGESVVSGEAPVDHWVLDRATLAVREARIAEKRVAIVPVEQGTQERALDAAVAAAPCLSPEQLAELGALVRRVAECYGWPQDVEWGWHAGRFYLLQSRPITRIPPRWTRDESAERFPNPMTPLVWEFLSEAFDAALPEALARMDMPALGPWFAMFDSYIYGNQNAVELVGGFRPFAARSLPELLAELPVIRTRYQWLLDMPGEWQRDLDRFLLAIGRMSSRSLDRMSVAELWAHLGELNQIGCAYFRPNITISLAHTILYRVLLHLVAQLRGPEAAPALVDALCAAPETRTALVNRELGELVRLAAHELALRDGLLEGVGRAMLVDGRLAAHTAFAAHLERFLEDYGHREIDLDYYHPTWSGQPWVVLDQVGSLLRAGELPAHGERESTQRRRQFEAEQALLAGAPRELGFFLHELIRLARVYAGLDDLEHFETTRLNAEGHRTAVELGARLHAAGLVDTPDDVFFFTRADLEQVVAAFPHAPEGGYRERVAAARERYRQALAQSPAWEATTDHRPPTTDHRPPTTDGHVLRGIAGSPGIVAGPVFRVCGPDDFGRFPAGAILVARTTNPAWTPLFYSAAGVVVESGGPLSHGAVTARELGLPAVMAVRGALSALHDGQLVRVDGARGEVELLEAGAPV
jgi:rifampicin phosphotransferase